MSEDDGPTERKKRFTIRSEDSEIPLVKPLFRSIAGNVSSAGGGTVTAAPSAGSYADYVFKQASTVKVPSCPATERPGSASASGSRIIPVQVSERESGPTPAVPNTVAVEAREPVVQPPPDAGGPIALENSSVDGKAQVPAKAVGKGSCLVVSPRQRGNPILKFVRNVPWEFEEIVPDYVMGPTTCALFLSLRYHNLNPNYIHERLKVLGQSFALRVLLVQVDVKDPHFALKELAKICILSDCTLILAWSAEEAGRYLETYKSYEQKPADVLKERVDQDFLSKITDCLTTVKSVNKTDCTTLLSTFGSLADLTNATRDDLSLCPGLGPQKAKRLFDVLHEPFQKAKK